MFNIVHVYIIVNIVIINNNKGIKSNEFYSPSPASLLHFLDTARAVMIRMVIACSRKGELKSEERGRHKRQETEEDE